MSLNADFSGDKNNLKINSINDKNSLEYVRIHLELCENYDRTLRIVENLAVSHSYIFKCGFLEE